jgi:FixJ family two-component response regulator
MPGMSGLELQRQMALTNSNLPIILITAHEEHDQKAKALEAGAVAFLNKPFYQEELLNAINVALKDSRSEGKACSRERQASQQVTHERE